jgi:hypothetical protein
MLVAPGNPAGVPLATQRTTAGRRRSTSIHGAELTPEEIAFGKAIDKYKRKHRKPFRTFSEILSVVHALGYRVVAPAVEV